MDKRHEARPDAPHGTVNRGERAAAPTTNTRRSFLADVGKKAAYITPVVLTLTASPAMATGHAESCAPVGSPCTVDHDCCSNNCNAGQCKTG